jgi:altronate hydrolase
MRSKDIIVLNPNDNVGVAAQSLPKGHALDIAGNRLVLLEAIRLGHKVALTGIARNQPVLKYGQPIGLATQDVPAGGWVHSHNLTNGDLARDYAPCSEIPPPPPPLQDRFFQGYRRADGRAGTRNYVAVISTVNCSASVAKYVARRFDREALSSYPHVDGVIALTHHGGCAMPFGGLQHELLNRVHGGFAKHPNVGAYLLIGLGCEQGAMGYLLQREQLVQIDGVTNRRMGPPVFSMQDCGGTAKTIEAASEALAKLLPLANQARRESIPASEIVLATECGGSDGNSGITANPAVGRAADLVVACGGVAILSETSEIYGAEHLLTRRAARPEVAEKLLERIAWWKWYASIFGGELDGNPSVGNKEGGLTTIAEKSLGAIAKGGSTALMDVYQYAEPVTQRGFVVMDTPGFDPPSVTGMVAGGANVVVFTTGRGSCFGCKPTPSIKVATNTPMYERMRDDMDLNAGEILHSRSVQEVGDELFQLILDVASGQPTKSEAQGLGDEEFVPWQIGPTL